MDRFLGYVLSMTTLTTRPLQPLLSFMTNPERRSRRRGRQRGDGTGQCTSVTAPSRSVGVGIPRRIGRDAAFAKVVEMEMTPGSSVSDDDSVKRAIVEQVDVYAHPASTVPMGLAGSGVVDAFGRVYGLRGLMVVDASIMPFVPSAPTNLTTIMIAEHVVRHCLVPGSAKASQQKRRIAS